MTKVVSPSNSIAHGKHHFFVRVYFEDTDSGEIVYYANYLKFAERSRTEMLREIGFGHKTLKENYGIGFVVSSCDVEFLKPAKLDDLLEIETEILMVRGASIKMRQKIKKDKKEIVIIDVKLACVGSNGSVKRLPPRLYKMMTGLNLSECEV